MVCDVVICLLVFGLDVMVSSSLLSFVFFEISMLWFFVKYWFLMMLRFVCLIIEW